MRPIDADELKTHKFLSPQVRVLGGSRNREAIVAAYQQGWNDAIDAIIENEPTVLHDNYSMGYQDGVKKVLSERPHGEWSNESKDSLLCSACGNRVYKPFIGGFPTERTSNYYPNFCAFCGADMREEAENEADNM